MIRKLEDMAGLTIMWSLALLCIGLVAGMAAIGYAAVRDGTLRPGTCACEGRR